MSTNELVERLRALGLPNQADAIVWDASLVSRSLADELLSASNKASKARKAGSAKDAREYLKLCLRLDATNDVIDFEQRRNHKCLA